MLGEFLFLFGARYGMCKVVCLESFAQYYTIGTLELSCPFAFNGRSLVCLPSIPVNALILKQQIMEPLLLGLYINVLSLKTKVCRFLISSELLNHGVFLMTIHYSVLEFSRVIFEHKLQMMHSMGSTVV